jgi:molybdopterin-guanine dinucleotide biosynthesis protein A
MKKHQKHAKIARPDLGQFARAEWALIGAPCSLIQQLAGQLIHRLSDQFALSWIDADHQSGEDGQQPGLKAGGTMAYTDKISHHQLEWKGLFESFQRRIFLNQADGALVNGNHFTAQRQIVILHPKKKDSLERKLDRLTRVELILTTEEQREPWDFLREHLPEIERIPTLPFDSFDAVAQWLSGELKAKLPTIHALVLAGGKSTRMGKDKGELAYHGKPQREHLAELLAPFSEKVYLSARPGQKLESAFPVLEDTFTGLGPYGAILSAFREKPDAAWMVVACDLPLVDEVTLRQLVENRNGSKLATAFYNKATDFPDPLITLWEPRAYPVLLQFLSQGYSCPRKVLINSEIEMIHPIEEEALMNVNTPEDHERVLQLLGTQS